MYFTEKDLVRFEKQFYLPKEDVDLLRHVEERLKNDQWVSDSHMALYVTLKRNMRVAYGFLYGAPITEKLILAFQKFNRALLKWPVVIPALLIEYIDEPSTWYRGFDATWKGYFSFFVMTDRFSIANLFMCLIAIFPFLPIGWGIAIIAAVIATIFRVISAVFTQTFWVLKRLIFNIKKLPSFLFGDDEVL